VAGTFTGGVVLYPFAIVSLRRLGILQRERADGPGSHLVKAGTPTSGGIVFCLVVAAAWVIALRDPAGGVLVAAAVLGAVVGFADDLFKVRFGTGMRVLPKFALLALCAAALAVGLFATGATRELVPGLGFREVGALGLALAAFALLATSNAANLTDGVDGLAAGCSVPAFAACGVAAAMEHRLALATTCWCVAAVLLAFLIYNRPKARIFMGDAGSLALGLMLAVAAAETGLLFLLPLLAAVFVIETVSVMAQVGYFKLTGGRRLLRMSPFHHHLELGGMGELEIDLRLWSVSVITAVLVVGWAVWSGLGGPHP
jgi:phospho-N-acetylmuramoyl-pentapeptide-transferase